MELSEAERLILKNQFQALSQLRDEPRWSIYAHVVSRGFTGEYYRFLDWFSSPVEEDSHESEDESSDSETDICPADTDKTSHLELTRLERVILNNQYQILSELSDEQRWVRYAEEVERSRTVSQVESRAWNTDELKPGACRRVQHILRMFTRLQESYEHFKSEPHFRREQLHFPGFDRHSESQRMQYSRFLIESLGQYQFLEVSGESLDAQTPMLDAYRQMLSVFDHYDDPPGMLTVHKVWEVLVAGQLGQE